MCYKKRLFKAVNENNYESLVKLTSPRFYNLIKGANVNAKDKNGISLLSMASFHNHKEIAELLIFKGADVNAKDNYGCSAIFQASYRGHKDIVELLIANGADINAKSKYGDTPLRNSSYYGHKEIVELLIDKGADVNAKGKYGESPLTNASDRGYKEIVRLLINNGADVNIMDDEGNTPLILASNKGFQEIIDLLVAKGAKQIERTEIKKSFSEELNATWEYLNSDGLRQEVEKAKQIRDQVIGIRKDSQGFSQTHFCHICQDKIYGEEAVNQLQKEAFAQNDMLQAVLTEKKKGYRCKSCGKEFCSDCLEKNAPGNAYGGKSCPDCNGLFEVI